MEVLEAIAKAEKNSNVKKLNGYFLCSCFACIKEKKDKITEWTLLFYSPDRRVVIDCFVNDKFVTMGEETPPIAEIEKPDFRDAKIKAEEAVDIVAKKFSKGTVNILLTLHEKNSLIWTVNMITADFNATTFDIDANTGKILREETTSLIRKM